MYSRPESGSASRNVSSVVPGLPKKYLTPALRRICIITAAAFIAISSRRAPQRIRARAEPQLVPAAVRFGERPELERRRPRQASVEAPVLHGAVRNVLGADAHGGRVDRLRGAVVEKCMQRLAPSFEPRDHPRH